MKQYLDLLRHVYEGGDEKHSRAVLLKTGEKPKTRSIFGYQNRYNLRDGFPLVTTKRMPFKQVAVELIWFLKGLTGRVNLTEIQASPLLRKPSGNHHSGGTLLNVADTTSGGGLSSYSILYNWILAGMPAGGVAANAGPNTNGSQFFVISGPAGIQLPPQYSLFGKVVNGLETLTAIEATGSSSGTPSEKVTIESVTITEAD